MPTLAKRKPAIPSLRSIEDLEESTDIEKVLNLSVLYSMTIDNSLNEFVERMGVWHPSACGMCKRAQVLAYTRVTPTDRQSKRVKEIFKLGHVIHDVVQEALSRLPEAIRHRGLKASFQKEVSYDPETDHLFREYGIGGTCDGLLEVWNDEFEQRGVVEIKSSGDEKFKEVQAQDTAFEKHLWQSHLYAYRFDRPIIWVFYFNKNTSTREVKPSLFQARLFEQALGYFDDCGDYVRRGKVPPREESYFECKDCVYRTLCDPVVLRSKFQHPSLLQATIKKRKPK